jgi:hypothetical protein
VYLALFMLAAATHAHIAVSGMKHNSNQSRAAAENEEGKEEEEGEIAIPPP